MIGIINKQTSRVSSSVFSHIRNEHGDLFRNVRVQIRQNTEYPQQAITCSKLTIETLEQGEKYVQS